MAKQGACWDAENVFLVSDDILLQMVNTKSVLFTQASKKWGNKLEHCHLRRQPIRTNNVRDARQHEVPINIFKFMVPCIINNGVLSPTWWRCFYFDTFTHAVHVSGIYHPSSGATTANWSGWYNNWWVLRPVGCYNRLVLSIALCNVDITQCDG
jgi:hypothetical protein